MRQIFSRQGILPRIAAVCGAVLLGLFCTVQYYAGTLPDHYYLHSGSAPTVSALLPVSITRTDPAAMQTAELRLFGMIPVKTVSVTAVPETDVYLGGEPFGIRMLMDGVMVISVGAVSTAAGSAFPAKEAGLRTGDIITTAAGRKITGNPDLQQVFAESGGDAVTVTFLRGDTPQTCTVQPAYSPSAAKWQAGMWVRDSTAGIGTVTYYTVTGNSVQFAGLGHAVCDADTGEQIPLASGDVAAVSVRDILRGSAGKPGELRGRFDPSAGSGTLLANTASGVFGRMAHLPQKQTLLPLGFAEDAHRGSAVIYTTLSGTAPDAYTVEIEEIHRADAALRHLVVHVTDRRLIDAAGGIVQGMSGSPIVQDGRLIGAVTHVFVRDPTRGYGILAEQMYTQTAAHAGAVSSAAAAFADAAAEGESSEN